MHTLDIYITAELPNINLNIAEIYMKRYKVYKKPKNM